MAAFCARVTYNHFHWVETAENTTKQQKKINKSSGRERSSRFSFFMGLGFSRAEGFIFESDASGRHLTLVWLTEEL